MKRKREISISIGVMCYPRNDVLTAEIVRRMAVAAAELLKPAEAERIRGEVDSWLDEHGLGGRK